MSAICDSVLFVSLTFSVSLSLYILVVVQINTRYLFKMVIYRYIIQRSYKDKIYFNVGILIKGRPRNF